MRTRKMTLFGILLLILTAAPAATLAQDEASAAAEGDTPTPEHVTWTGAWGWSFPMEATGEEMPWGPRAYSGYHVALTSDDPRIAGQMTYVELRDGPSMPMAGESSRSTSLVRIENDAGAWQGPVTKVIFPDYLQVEYGWLKGEGEYEGLSYFTSYHDDTASDIHHGQGMIWPGDPPPVPDPALMAAELAD